MEEIPCVVGGREVFTGDVQKQVSVSEGTVHYVEMCGSWNVICFLLQPYDHQRVIAQYHYADKVIK